LYISFNSFNLIINITRALRINNIKTILFILRIINIKEGR
jgi:hypothetical protein